MQLRSATWMRMQFNVLRLSRRPAGCMGPWNIKIWMRWIHNVFFDETWHACRMILLNDRNSLNLVSKVQHFADFFILCAKFTLWKRIEFVFEQHFSITFRELRFLWCDYTALINSCFVTRHAVSGESPVYEKVDLPCFVELSNPENLSLALGFTFL